MVRENGMPLDVKPLVLDSTEGTIQLRACRAVMIKPPSERTAEGIQLVADWLWEYMRWDYDGMKFEVLYKIAAQAEYKRVDLGTVIYDLNQWDTDQMYIILAGVVCFVSENMTQVHAVGAGCCFGEYEISREEPTKRIAAAIAGNNRPTVEFLLVPKEIYKEFLAPSLAMVDSSIFELTKAYAIFRQGAHFPIQWQKIKETQWREVNRHGRDEYMRRIALAIMFLLRIDRIYFNKSGRRLWQPGGYQNFKTKPASLPLLKGSNDPAQLGADAEADQSNSGGHMSNAKLAGVVNRCKWTLMGNSIEQRQAVREELAYSRGVMLLQLVPAVQAPDQPEVERLTAIQLYKTMNCMRVTADRMIFSSGDDNRQCYIVLSGEVEFQRPGEKPKKYITGDFFGVETDPQRANAAAFMRSCQARAKTDCELGCIPQRVYLQHLDEVKKRNLRDNLEFAMQLDYCQGLPHPWLVKLAQCFTRIKLRKAHQALLRPGDPVTCVFFLVNGSIKVMKSFHLQKADGTNASEAEGGAGGVVSKEGNMSAQEDLQMKLLSLHTAAERQVALKKASLVVRLEPPAVLGLQEMVHRRDKYDVNVTCTSSSCTLLALSAEDFKHLFIDGPHKKCYEMVKSSAQKVHNAMSHRLQGRKTSVMNRIAKADLEKLAVANANLALAAQQQKREQEQGEEEGGSGGSGSSTDKKSVKFPALGSLKAGTAGGSDVNNIGTGGLGRKRTRTTLANVVVEAMVDAEDKRQAQAEGAEGSSRWRVWDGSKPSASNSFQTLMRTRAKGLHRDLKKQGNGSMDIKKSDVSPLTTIFPKLKRAANAMVADQRGKEKVMAGLATPTGPLGRRRSVVRQPHGRHSHCHGRIVPKRPLKGLFKADAQQVDFSKCFDTAISKTADKLFAVCPTGPKVLGPRDAAIKQAQSARMAERRKIKQQVHRINKISQSKIPKVHRKLLEERGKCSASTAALPKLDPRDLKSNNSKTKIKVTTDIKVIKQTVTVPVPRKTAKKLPKMPDWLSEAS